MDNDSANPDTSSSASSSFYLLVFFFPNRKRNKGNRRLRWKLRGRKRKYTKLSLSLFFGRKVVPRGFSYCRKRGTHWPIEHTPFYYSIISRHTKHTVSLYTHETLLNTARGERAREPNVRPSLFFNTFFILLFYTFSGKGDTRENGRVASPLSVSSNSVRQTDQRPYYSDHFLLSYTQHPLHYGPGYT